ncbi:DUF1877 family protein [Aestuariimicrobium soli]|uniref:DUF1877 family protein n=1 Tax=Aestuariimicrobium soli TaxID=2035834 RepID=UPI003EBA8586
MGGIDVTADPFGYGGAQWLDPGQVTDTSDYLAEFDVSAAILGVDVGEMNRGELYPAFSEWSLDYVSELVNDEWDGLCRLYHHASSKKLGGLHVIE